MSEWENYVVMNIRAGLEYGEFWCGFDEILVVVPGLMERNVLS